MSKIALACDSGADIPQEVAEKYNIHVAHLSVIFDQEEYKEGVDIKINDFYDKVREAEELPKTSQPPIGEFVELYEKLAKEGYDDVIVVTLSAGISGTNQTAQSAATMVEGINVHVFDSEIAAFAEGFYVMEAAKLIEEGKSIDEILERLGEIRSRKVKAYFMVDDLKHLHRGGRLSGAQAFVGSLLKMKPILVFENNSIHPIEKIRTKKKAVQRIKDIFAEQYDSYKEYRLSVIHAHRPEDAAELENYIRDTYSNVEVDNHYIGPSIGTHVGEGTLAFVWYEK